MSITKIFDYFKRREEQLEKERLIDEKVAQLPCSSVVTQLLLSDRKFNREQTKEYSRSSTLMMFSLANKNMEEINQRQEEINWVAPQFS